MITNKNKRGGLIKHYYCLAELLIYLVVLLFITGSFMKLFHSAVQYNRKAMRHAQTFQEIQLIHREWKRLVHQTNPQAWGLGKESFHAGKEYRVIMNEGKLSFLAPGSRVKQLRIHPGMTVSFKLEKDGAEPESRGSSPARAVLVLTWKSPRLANRKPETIRLVACVPRPNRSAPKRLENI